MFYLEKDGFKFSEHLPDSLYLETDRLDACIQYAIAHRIENFCLHDGVDGYTASDINGLRHPDLTIRRLSISSEAIVDVAPLNDLKNLTHLDLSVNRKKCKGVDLAHSQETLRELATNIFDKITGIDCLPELEVFGGHVYSATKDLGAFKGFPKLKSLLIAGGNLESLHGLTSCDQLEDITIYSTPALVDVEALWSLPQLKSLRIEQARRIKVTLDKAVPSLESVDMMDCGEQASLRPFVQYMPNLSRLNLWGTTILDADLTWAFAMKHLEVLNLKPHPQYNLKPSQIKKLAGKLTPAELQQLRERTVAIVPSGVGLKLPTEDWKEEGDLNPKQIKSVEKLLKAFLKLLANQSNEAERLKAFEFATTELDTIQTKHEYFIGTIEREQLVAFFTEVAHMVGLEAADDITWTWRKEW